ncbi:MAG: signal peptidase I [Verrucomicrobiaceae bacterium]|nr:signal peptidase I [Verrucomicrobiaceae bacterium]
MFGKKYLKQAKLLKKGVKKFLRYKQDILPSASIEKVKEKLSGFEEAIATKEKEAIKRNAKALTDACEEVMPPSSYPGLRENLEVIFVAVIIAVGIRAYFVQPFRIPTGSMQPTLNGIIGYPQDDQFEVPGFLGRAFDKVIEGRTYVDFTIPAGAKISSIAERTRFKFFTSTRIAFADPSMEPVKVGVSRKSLLGDGNGSDLGLLKKLSLQFYPNGRGGMSPRVGGHNRISEDLRIRGYVDTGDQVLVNKFSYHFRRPQRGEVFVFNTGGITGIPLDNPAQGSQHYIKRLTGLPGDRLEIRNGDPKLYVDGEPASEEFVRRVWKGSGNGYRGYGYVPATKTDEWSSGVGNGKRMYSLADGRYMALGDNSYNSSDSRMWGSVPEPNLVGPALMVYWPFEHWGRIP